MGLGYRDDENPALPEDEREAEKQRLNTTEDMEMQKIPVKIKDAEYPEIVAYPKKPTFKTSHLKYAVIGLNGFGAILGFVILALSIWIRADSEFWRYETNLKVGNFYTVCYLLMFAGVVVLLVSFLGCCGAVTENKWMLLSYTIVFCVIVIVEIAALGLLFSAPHSPTISNQLEKGIQKQLVRQYSDDSAREFMDFLQSNLACCGSINSEDYKAAAPNSCLNPRNGRLYSEGCSKKMLVYLRVKAGIIGGIAVPLLLLQILGLLAAFFLFKNLQRDSRYEM